jgi:hypothetical protein
MSTHTGSAIDLVQPTLEAHECSAGLHQIKDTMRMYFNYAL